MNLADITVNAIPMGWPDAAVLIVLILVGGVVGWKMLDGDE